jgi:DNA-binding NarL/FixJ family response regulator
LVEAVDGNEALAALEQGSFDLVVLDLDLPGRDGFQILEDLRRRGGTRAVVLSAIPEQEVALRCLRLGAAAFLGKGCEPRQIHAAVAKALAGGRYVSPELAERLADLLGDDLRQAPHEALSERELQVLRLVAGSKTIKEIAAEMRLRETTIATYRARLSEKLALSSNVELAKYALRHKLVN